MIRGILGRCCHLSSSFVRYLNEFQARGLHSLATGVTPCSSWRDRVSTTSLRISHWRWFSTTSEDSGDAFSDIPSDSSESKSNEATNSKTDARSLLDSMNSYQFEQYLQKLSTSQSHIPYKDLLKITQKNGVAATLTASHQLCKEMFASGALLRYGNQVYLNPNEIVDRIRSILPGSVEDTQKLIEALEVELEPLEKERKDLESKTAYWHKAFKLLGLYFLVTQFCCMYWLTFVIYSWDVTAPFAYFINLSAGIVILAYHMVFRRELGHSSLRSVVRSYVLRNAKVFDEAKYKALVQQIETHRNVLSRLKR
eukprot:g4667.t1